MSGIRAGQLRKRALVQQRSSALDAFGGQLVTWTDLKTIWCEILELSGRELYLAQTIAAEVTHQVNCRYDPIFALPKVVATYRLSYKGRIFNVHGCTNEGERDRAITLSASEGLNDG
jgi:SPP1 family predicted phage head-tail adaptor